MTTQILTSRAAARELRKSDERINWCAIESYFCGDLQLDCLTSEREEFQDTYSDPNGFEYDSSFDSDELSPELFAAFRRFLRV